jgi:hypothetical protein
MSDRKYGEMYVMGNPKGGQETPKTSSHHFLFTVLPGFPMTSLEIPSVS